ncbi:MULTISPECIES: helix-turn-helix domain-containing protein [Ureibacillus]|uniref:Helix-turn-helix domain-containing protein n=2 Tax=Bacillati TaxID=1783272 RepID=A0A540V6V3_9BACL|nr:RodZ domain-containing protein [Ureibacillus terrenus]MED3660464.1 helix-turn-helix domain-containing protein [Ureibacillus terrenus]MED3762619.1 helix-turn-helix domain-containing protein [Ureibacillus terrenus]TQE92500.1 helix-turn-helix domain-containing protein [Ureibacillus terrenus]
MTELGTRLKEARLSKGYSLDDLQEITKIQKRYLIAIEEGNYSIMPGTFYVRAFIKQYAEAVGLDPDEIFEQYKNEIPSHQTEEVAQSFSQSPARKKLKTTSASKLMEALPKYVVALFIVIIIAVLWFFFSQRPSAPDEQVTGNNDSLEYEKTEVQTPSTKEGEKANKKENADESPAANDEENKDEEQEEQKEEEKQTISAGEVQPDGITTIYKLSGTDKMQIRVEVSGNTWVSIRDKNQNEQVEARVYSQGEVVEHDSTANGYARIRLGASNNAKVFVNGEEIKYVLDKTTQNIVIEFSQEQ